MEAKEVKKLMEAYASVYTQQQEIIVEEDCECEEEESGKETPEMNGKKKGKKEKEEMKEETDLFDYLLEYLVAEGYADTNKAALAIMANMSEDWKQSIVEQDLTARQKYLVGKVGEMNKREPGSAHKYTPGKQNPGAALDRANTSAMQMRGV